MFGPDRTGPDALMPRPDGRDVHDQLHGRTTRRDGVWVPHRNGNVSLTVRTHDPNGSSPSPTWLSASRTATPARRAPTAPCSRS